MHPDVYKRPLLWVLIALLFIFSFCYQPKPSKNDVSHLIKEKQVDIVGVVDSFPVTRKGTENIFLSVQMVNGQKRAGRVYARLSNFTPHWKDTLSFKATLQTPYGIDLIGNFNWQNYLKIKGIFTEAKGRDAFVVKEAPWYYQVIRKIRGSILNLFQKSFSPDLANIAGGILLGERGEISKELYTDFQDSGAIHLLVASGGNVGFVVLMVLWALSFFTFPQKYKLVGALLVAGIYTLIAGADVPLVRAYLMSVCSCVGFLLGRNSGVIQGLFIACLIIVGVQPASVLDVGFQMSFLATLSIVIVLNSYQLPKKWPKTLKSGTQIFLSTLACQLVLIPIFANVFFKVSLIGVFSNLILVPFASVLMAVSFLYYLFSLVHISILFYPCLWALELFKFLVEWFASFSYASIPLTAWKPGTIVAYYILLFLVFNLPNRTLTKQIYKYCLGASLVILLGQLVFNKPALYVLNEWGKHAVIVQMPSKKVVVFNEGLGSQELQNTLYKIGTSQAEAQFLLKEKTKTKKDIFLKEVPTLIPNQEIKFGQCVTYDDVTICLKEKEENEPLTYTLSYQNHSLTIAQQGKKIISNNKVLFSSFNKTVSSSW